MGSRMGSGMGSGMGSSLLECGSSLNFGTTVDLSTSCSSFCASLGNAMRGSLFTALEK